MHGGNVTVQSQPHTGSTFTWCCQGAADDSMTHPRRQSAFGGPRSSGWRRALPAILPIASTGWYSLGVTENSLKAMIALAAAFVASLAIIAAIALARAGERTRRLAGGLVGAQRRLAGGNRPAKQVQEELDKERFLFHVLMNNVPERIL